MYRVVAQASLWEYSLEQPHGQVRARIRGLARPCCLRDAGNRVPLPGLGVRQLCFRTRQALFPSLSPHPLGRFRLFVAYCFTSIHYWHMPITILSIFFYRHMSITIFNIHDCLKAIYASFSSKLHASARIFCLHNTACEKMKNKKHRIISDSVQKQFDFYDFLCTAAPLRRLNANGFFLSRSAPNEQIIQQHADQKREHHAKIHGGVTNRGCEQSRQQVS